VGEVVQIGDIRDQLQTLTGAELLASQLSSAGGKAFVSLNAKPTQLDMNEVTNFWRSIHVPTYGNPIPNSGATVSSTVAADPVVLQVATNEVATLQAMILTNADGANPGTVTLTLDSVIFLQMDVPPSSTMVAIGFQGLDPGSVQVVGGQQIGINVSGVATSELSYALSYCRTSQG